MTNRITDKVCVVTGAGSGIGRASAIRLAEEGGRVLCADLNESSALETASLIEAAGGTSLGLGVDVSSSAAVDVMIEITIARWG